MFRKIFAFLPAALSTAIIVYLTVMLGDIVPLLAVFAVLFIGSGIAVCPHGCAAFFSGTEKK